MKKLIMLFVIITAVPLFASGSNINYQLYTYDKDAEQTLTMNKFYFVNYIYTDFFEPFQVNGLISLKERASIIKALYTSLEKNYQKELSITVKEGTDESIISIYFKSVPVEEGISLLVFTNYDLKLKKFIQKPKDFKNCFAIQYMIIDGTLIPWSVYSDSNHSKKIDEYKNKNDFNMIADEYLFDTDRNNDGEIIQLIEKGITASVNDYDISLLKLTYAQYFMREKKFFEAKKLIEEVNNNKFKISDKKNKIYISDSIATMREMIYILNEL